MIRKLAVIAAALCLAGCGGAAPKGAAESASRLLAAALKGDRVAFEAEIDRAAVRDDVRRQIADVARGKALEVEGGPSEFALDRMISPAAIRVVHAGTGEALTAPPTTAQVAKLMREVDGKRACVRGRKGDCLLTFAKEKRDWRLVGMKAMDVEIAVAAR
jgi:hypothetical protein